MREREPNKENISRGELFYLGHPGTQDTFSGYGLSVQEGDIGRLVGLLMADRPTPVDPEWLEDVQQTYGEYQLVPMTASGDRGIACRMQVEPESQVHLRRFPGGQSAGIARALEPLLEGPPKPLFNLWWDEDHRLWRSLMPAAMALPAEIREVFDRTGYGCLAAETSRGVMHVCHAADTDIENFPHKPVGYRWQLIKMKTAPLIRLDIQILDRLESPFRFESFLNIAAADQAQILYRLASQDKLLLAFYGDNLTTATPKKSPTARSNGSR